MRYKLTKPYQRIFDLLNILLDANSPLSKFEVAEEIHCSRPTLDRTIIDANILIKEFSQIEFTNEGLFLAKSGYLNKRQVRSLISNETFVVQFLTDLLFGKFNKVEEWSEAKFHSPSVIYRKVKNLEFFLGRIGITLVNDESGLMLKGDSWRIRYLYFQIFKEKAIIDDHWPFKDFEYHVLLKFVKAVCAELEVRVSPIVEYFFSLMTAIHLVVSKSAYTEEIIKNERYLLLLNNHNFQQPLKELEAHIGGHFTEEEKAMLISSIELFPVTYETEAAMHRRVVHSTLSDHLMYHLAFQVYQIFHPREKDLTKFVQYLDIFTSLEMLNDFQVINFDGAQSQPLHLERSRQTEIFMSKILQVEEKMKSLPYYGSYDTNRALIQQKLYFLFQTYAFMPNIEPLSVTIVSQEGHLKEKYYKHRLIDNFFSERIRTIDSQLVHEQDLWNEVDLILTDYTLSSFQKAKTIYYLDNDLTTNDIQKIDELVTRLEKARLKNY
ncbi:helix-turn-helix domain-containing protein [Vagococcus salmoninarum]|uniref:helix-turn-helix domain-containing protein n=1 Tax=Vagococcus salmoninarum TaxID=2739 RepID=UPI0018821B12|nr:helix-turn-helix domain-containing protein [Vagococcus salmoninarum]MBE9387947.1 helix-turn-helix domain-containing protein [Vagococcus salmoninarum]